MGFKLVKKVNMVDKEYWHIFNAEKPKGSDITYVQMALYHNKENRDAGAREDFVARLKVNETEDLVAARDAYYTELYKAIKAQGNNSSDTELIDFSKAVDA